MKNAHFIGTVLLGLVLLASACSPAPTPLPPTDTSAPVSAMTSSAAPASSTAPASAPASASASSMASASASAPASGTAGSASMSAASGPATVATSSSATLGTFLVDGHGMTLYLFTKDSPNTSTCSGNCAKTWPPLLTNGAPVAGTGADASKLGTTMRADGTTQVTYSGWPLYYYAKDTAMGDVNGQNVGSVWFVIAPDGTQINK